MQPTVEDDAGGDAGPDGEVGEILCVADDAPLMEADGRGAHVVLDDDRAAELELERVAEGEVGPAEIDRERHAATPRVDPAGDTHADCDQVLAGEAGIGEGLIEGVDGRNGAALVTHGGGVGGATEDGAVGVDDERRDLGAADVDPGDGSGELAIAAFVAVERRVAVLLGVIDAPSGRARGSAAAQAPRSVTSSPVPPSSHLGLVARGCEARPVASCRMASSHGSPRAVTRRPARDADVERADEVGDGLAQRPTGGPDDAEGSIVALRGAGRRGPRG